MMISDTHCPFCPICFCDGEIVHSSLFSLLATSAAILLSSAKYVCVCMCVCVQRLWGHVETGDSLA